MAPNFDIESIELALDGVVGMTTGYATLLLTGNSEIAEVAADTAMETAGLARKYTLSIFMWAGGGMGTHLDEYYNKIIQCEKTNIHVPTPIEYFGSDSDVYKALSKRHLKTLNRLAYNTERLRLIKNYGNSPKIPSYETYVDTNSKNNYIANKSFNRSKRSIIFGDTTQAQKAYVEAIKRVGEPNVKWVKSIPSNFDRQMIAASFGADTIRIFKHTRYREIIRGGIRQIIPNPELKISSPEKKKPKHRKRNDIVPDTEEWALGGGPPPPPTVDFGGVYIDPDPEYAGEVENGLANKVLVNRPSNDSSSWSVPLPEGIK